MHIAINDLKIKIHQWSLSAGLNDSNAEILTDIFMRSTFRAVGHHDIHDLHTRFKYLLNSQKTANPEIKKVYGYHALEAYDGDNGLGELCSYYITKRSMKLASQYGIGLASIRNSTHFLAAAPYCEIAEEAGYFTLIFSKCLNGLSVSGANKIIMGNNPFGYAAATDEGNILFDVCCAYSSYGKMRDLAGKGEQVPEYWGNDSSGKATDNPDKILESGQFMPIGEHKGFGLAIMVELLTSMLSGGTILQQPKSETGLDGSYSQTAITIDVSRIGGGDGFQTRNQTMVDMLRALYPEIQIPGERSAAVKKEIQTRGYFDISIEAIEKIEALFH